MKNRVSSHIILSILYSRSNISIPHYNFAHAIEFPPRTPHALLPAGHSESEMAAAARSAR
eukprot:SAG25_NODE_14588_length_253_cov_0.662338_2_plen_59_part_01